MEIKSLFEEALLAQAAYASLSAGMEGVQLIDALKSLEPKGLTQAQAEYFAEHYVVVQQSENIHTGFSATLFQNIESGKYHLATRSSVDFSFNDPDWVDANADNFLYGMAYDQVADLINFYLRLITPSTESTAQFLFEEVTEVVGSPPPAGGIFLDHKYDEGIDSDGDGVDDIIGDIYLTFKQVATYTGSGFIAKDQQLNVTGHSLGGHLASAC